MRRRKTREVALQILFMLENDDFAHANSNELIQSFHNQFPDDKGKYETDLLEQILEEYLKNPKGIDQFIESSSENWKLSRMSMVDRNILRLATIELTRLHDIDSSVSIDEAIEIAKKFGSENSAKFINGILDQIYKKQQ